jgi:alanyl-tRNA synthetase
MPAEQNVLPAVEVAESQFGHWPALKVRETFLDYFKQNGHNFWPSSSCIPYEDPTLLFANAGMNQVSRTTRNSTACGAVRLMEA